MTLTSDQLKELTSDIHARLVEFETPEAPMPSRAIVRAYYDVICAYLGRQEVMATVNPLRSQADDPEATAKRQAEFDAIVGEIQRVAMGGVMPKPNVWDAARPAHLPKSAALMHRYQKTWGQLAEIAGLSLERHRSRKDTRPHLNGTFAE